MGDAAAAGAAVVAARGNIERYKVTMYAIVANRLGLDLLQPGTFLEQLNANMVRTNYYASLSKVVTSLRPITIAIVVELHIIGRK